MTIDAEILNSNQALTVMPQNTAVSLSRDPQEILADAHKAAKALMDVVSQKKDKVMMNGRQYLVYEDWQTVGRFFNLVPRVREDKLIQIDIGGGKKITGYEATADVTDLRTGDVITTAIAMCLNDEEKWGERSKYEYQYCLKGGGTSKDDPGFENIVWIPNPAKPGKNMPKKEKVLSGAGAVPLFQLRSMAQTRACAKALRNAMAWVAVLAGYAPTPAEELDQEPDARSSYEEPPQAPAEAPAGKATPKRDAKAATATAPPPPAQAAAAPPAAPAPSAPANPGAPVKKISAGDLKRFWTIRSQQSWTDDEVRALLQKECGVVSSQEIPEAKYLKLIDTLQKGPVATGYRKGEGQ